MYLGIENTSWFSIAYFLTLVIIGNFIILNLFLAILIDTFVEGTSQDKEDLPSEEAKVCTDQE